MAALGTNFDASKVQPAEAAAAVWAGVVPVTIVKTEVKPSASNPQNKFLQLDVRAAAGEYVGQVNAIRLNLWNSSPQAADIAQRELSSLCHVTGKMAITDSDQLLNLPFVTVWVMSDREVTDQTTGQKRKIEGCDCKEYRTATGQTIKELMSGQPAASPYPPAGGAGGGASQGSFPGAAGPAPAQAPQGGFAQPGQAVQGQAGGTPQAGGFGTAASPSNGPAGGGFGQAGPSPGAAAGFGAGGFGGAPAAMPGQGTGFGAAGGPAPSGFGGGPSPGFGGPTR